MTDPSKVHPAGRPDAEVVEALARATSKVAGDINDQVASARRVPSSQKWKPVVSGLLSIVALVAWLAFPPRADDTDPRSPDRVRRDLKIEIASLAQQVEDFRDAHSGALPGSLAEADASSEIVQYRLIGPLAYELRGTERDLSMTYQSTEKLAAFTAGLVIQGARP